MAKLHKGIVAAGLTILFAIGIAWASSGGPYEISWYSVDGGGGTSQQGAYELTGVIGQCEAGTASGGPYSLEGGFLVGRGGEDTAVGASWLKY